MRVGIPLERGPSEPGRGSEGRSRPGASALSSPHGLSGGMQGPLQIAQQPLQPPASAPGGRQVIGNHPRMAEIQQKGGLLGGEAQKVLVVVVDDSHQAFKRNLSFVGRNAMEWMGKAVRSDRSGLIWPPPRRWPGSAPSGGGMEPGGDFHHNQPEEGHGNQQGARMGHASSARKS